MNFKDWVKQTVIVEVHAHSARSNPEHEGSVLSQVSESHSLAAVKQGPVSHSTM